MHFIRSFCVLGVCSASLALSGCATEYASSGFAGGYSDTQLAPDVFRVTFSGNGFTPGERAQDFAMLRAADLTLKSGFRYFAVMNSAEGGSTSTITLPGQAYTTASATAYGNSAYGTSTTTYTPPTNIPVFKPRSGLMIRCFRDRPGEFAFDAAFLSRSLRAKYGIKA